MSELLAAGRSQLLVVDVQERLAPAMAGAAEAVANVVALARAAVALGVPITISEQYPKGLGATLPAVLEACGERSPVFPKVHFSCARDPALSERLTGLGRRQIIVCGFEAHVCVLQSALELQTRGAEVFVAADAAASRRAESKEIALRRLAIAGAMPVTTEMVVFEWLERAGTDQFKAVSPLLR